MILIWVALGGALGACARYLAGLGIHSFLGSSWPVATLTVNLLGSIGIGAVFILLEKGQLHEIARPLLLVGFLGGFTTFSTFSLELLVLVERGSWGGALTYAATAVMACFVGVFIGTLIARA